ncbi:MAG: histidine triad nucleotide-binding protein [Elusimicrobia bacterium]|nr:histidine triad nucleotide-binding protein [Elusimicrobiota bacterium]
MADCIFCRIIEKEVQARIIREDADMVAIYDLNPQAPTHVILIPKKHIACLAKAQAEDIELLGKLQYAAKEIARELGIGEAFRLVLNNGHKAGQTVDHIHYHLLGGRRLMWPPG